MGLISAAALFSLPFYNSPLSSVTYKISPYGRSKFVVFLAVLLAISSLCECTTEEDQPATQQKQFNALGQRLVRRNFLRFGKRSGPSPVIRDDDDEGIYFGGDKINKRGESPAPTGPGELYEAMLMGKQPHSTSARSFLRFGKRAPFPTQSMGAEKRRADNFLRFGKSVGEDPTVEDLLGRWKKFLLIMLAKVAEEEDALLHNRQAIEKKAGDFLRFG